MNHQQAKDILVLYRPETADADDPSFAEALELCQHDPELQRWFEEQCALYTALRRKFRQTAVPPGLKEQIVAEWKVQAKVEPRRRPVVLALAAAMVLAAAVFVWFLTPAEKPGFAAYQGQMTSIALCDYAMDLATNDHAQVRGYLARKGAPADYAVPAALQQAALTGCAITTWQGAPVSMICFRSGKPLPGGQSSDLWLFVVDAASVRSGPIASTPSLTRVNRAMTATWSVGGKVYLLVADGDQEFLRKYL
jgi:hypothetical protein